MHPADSSPSGCAGKGRDKAPVSSLSKILTSFFIVGMLAFGTIGTAKAATFTITSTCDTLTSISGFTLMFDSVTYDQGAGTSQWNYTLEWDGTPPALSHFMIELCSLVTNADLVAVSPSDGSIGPDGSTGLFGIKWDDIQNFPANTPVHYSFTLNGLYTIESGAFAPKAGINSNIASICGPSINCDVIDDCGTNSPPILTCAPDITIECGTSHDTSAVGSATATDPDGDFVTLTFSDGITVGACLADSIITRVWVATDSCGNTDVCVQTITIHDTTPPPIICPPTATVECGASNDPSVTGSATATDACDPNPEISFTDAASGSSCTGDSAIIRTWTATDCSGNSSSCDQTINVTDTTPPPISCPANASVECGDPSDPSVTGSATATDVCDANPIITFSDVVTGNSCTGDSLITRTWTATDCSGNSASCDQSINVTDTTPPMISCPANITIECGSGDPTGSATATDICDPNPTIDFSDVVTFGQCLSDTTIVRTWTATDCSGNSSSCDQTISIRDTTPPPIICPPTATVECGDPNDPSVTGSATATDVCDPSPTITFTDAASGSACTGDSAIIRTWTATDCSGNSSSCDQTINVTDTTPPVISCPANVTVECGDPSDPSVTGSATATDVCDANPTITFSDVVTGNSCSGDSLITRTWTATDCSGNLASCDQLINVTDTKPPVITCPANITIECGSGAPTGSATATDCDPNPSIDSSDVVTPGQCPSDTTILRTWTATDCSGNSSSCTQTIEIRDTKPPIITCPVIATVECGNPSDPSVTGMATAVDSCDASPDITFADVSTGTSCNGDSIITRTWTAVDCSGNSASCDQIINVTDTTPPVITCPSIATVECGNPSDPSVTGSATANDACDANPTISFSDVVTGNSCTGDSLITRIWTATDCSGNSASCNQLINVNDTSPPVITCPANITIECGSGASTGTATAADCDPDPIIDFSDVVTQGQCPSDTTIVRTWTATDCNGNSSSCDQTITIRDTTPPVIACPAAATVECGASRDTAVTGSATANDVCDPDPRITFSDVVVGQSANDTTVTRTWVATDCSGNSDSCVQIITVSCSILKTCIAITQTNRADDGSLLPPDQHSIQGDHEKVYVVHEAGNRRIGAFDFLIAYDNSALAFTGAEGGNVYTDREWEFFTFRFGPTSNCDGGCPSGKLRVIGIANQAGDGHTPLTFLPEAGDTLACLDFLVSNDRTLECQFVPIRFCWLDCGDNVLSDQTGDTLSISCKVYDYQGTGSLGAHGNRAEITDLNADFPTLYGAPSACEVSGGPGKPTPDRNVNYKNGGIKIACADDIDARGDINLNGLSNEIADAVLYTKYFIDGPSVFTLAAAGQIAASDVNADGLPLTIADLVYLIRVIVGDALPIPKLAHNSLSVEFNYSNGVISTSHDLGAALFVFEGQAEIDLLQTRLELKIGYREGRTYALIAPSLESQSIGEYVHAGELIATDAAPLSIEASDYDGAVVETLSKVVMPTNFALHQNYPNPFNPATKFRFDLPEQTAYRLSVYNVSGQLVAEFNGEGAGTVEVVWDASSVASGMYFYKLSAGKFTSTRKALLLK